MTNRNRGSRVFITGWASFMKRVLAAFLCLSIFTLVGCQRHDVASGNAPVRIGVLNTPNDVAVARHLGYFKEAFPGRKISFITFDSGVDANKALMSGGVDFATMGDTNGVVALSAGIPVRLLWINEICGANEALVARDGCKIHCLEDVAGKTIATPFASTSHYSLMIALKQAGLTHKVRLLDMDTQNIVAAWQRGNIDAAYTWQPTLTELLKNGQVLIDSSDLGKKGVQTGNITLVREAILQERPDDARRFTEAVAKAHRLRASDPAKAVAAAAAQTGISVAEAKTQVAGTTWLTQAEMYRQDGLGTPSHPGAFTRAMMRTGQFMHQQQTVSTAPTLSEFSTFIDTGGK